MSSKTCATFPRDFSPGRSGGRRRKPRGDSITQSYLEKVITVI